MAKAQPPDWHFFVVPRCDYRTVDNWQVAGLQGTGSIDVILEDVFVPGYRAQRMQDNFQLKGAGQAVNTSSLYRLPFGQIFVRGVSTAGLGALHAMLTALSPIAASRVTRAGGRSADNPAVQLLCAETAAAIDEMRTTLHRNCRMLHDYARRDEMPPVDLRLQYKFQSSEVIERCTHLAAAHLQGDRRGWTVRRYCRSAEFFRISWRRGNIFPINTSITAAIGAPSMFGLENKDFLL